MASLSFRDRFYSKPVARAVTSPGAIWAAGAGAAVGILATAPVSLPFAVVAAVAGGALGFGARVAAAIPARQESERIDPFAVSEPWRHAVVDALQAQGRFRQALQGFKAGPLRDAMASVGVRLDDAVAECWRVAQRGQRVSDAARAINRHDIESGLERVRGEIATDGDNPTRARRLAALESQRDSADRLDALVASAQDRLDLLNVRLDEIVTRAIELSVTNQAGVGELGHDVSVVVDDLESLRVAMTDVQDLTGDGTVKPR